MNEPLPIPRPRPGARDLSGYELARAYGMPGLTGKNRCAMRTWRRGHKPKAVSKVDIEI